MFTQIFTECFQCIIGSCYASWTLSTASGIYQALKEKGKNIGTIFTDIRLQNKPEKNGHTKVTGNSLSSMIVAIRCHSSSCVYWQLALYGSFVLEEWLPGLKDNAVHQTTDHWPMYFA